ncbi:hypothetical protein V6U90_11750 [Micromonospora sp. CPCC 206060]|uniref:hypothetical protein n=1 Tax=Micromonospora sp. CPCC 206060 TaxID=3122406 RepID=UPI002FF270B1
MAQRRPTKPTRCPDCGYQWHTLAIGRSATCRQCGVQHYVPADPTAAVPLAQRPHREVTCRHCGHTWATRRPPQSAVPCSQCGRSVWVPLSARVVESPAAIRRQAAELSADRPARPARPSGPPVRPARPARVPRPARVRRPPATAAPAASYAPALSTLAALVSNLTRSAAPPAARTAPAPPAPRPTPAPLAAPVAAPTGSPHTVGPDTARVLAAIGQRDYLSPDRLGDCPFYVVSRGAMCGLAAPYRVLLTPDAYLPACQGHAQSIRAQAAQHGVPFPRRCRRHRPRTDPSIERFVIKGLQPSCSWSSNCRGSDGRSPARKEP